MFHKDLSVYLLLIRLKLQVWERKTTKYMPFSSHLLENLWLAGLTIVYAKCDQWVRQHLPGFSTIKWLLSSPLYRTFNDWNDVIIWSPHLRNKELCYPSLRKEYLHKLLLSLCMGDLHILYHLFILFLKLNWKDGKTKVRVQIHQIETPDDSPPPAKLLFQEVQTRAELCFHCMLGIGNEGRRRRGEGRGGRGGRGGGSEHERDPRP